MKDRFFGILHLFIKTFELLAALAMLAYPLLIYFVMRLGAGTAWDEAAVWQRLAGLALIGGPSMLCGLVWLKLIWRRRQRLSEYDPPGKEDEK